MSETNKPLEQEIINKTDALIQLGIITAGTQLTTTAIHRLAKYPVFLFGLGMITGIYLHKNKKQILASADYVVTNAKQILLKKEDTDN